MPRYVLDTNDGDMLDEDDVGLELANHEVARPEAVAALPDMARDRLPDGDRCNFSVRVRDEAGTTIYSASLALTGEWHV